MGVDHTAYAAWGWQIPYSAVPGFDPDVDQDEDFEEAIEKLCQGIDDLGWLQLGARSYGWDMESCPLVLCVGGAARVDFHEAKNILDAVTPVDPVTARRIQDELKERGVEIQKPIGLLLGGVIW